MSLPAARWSAAGDADALIEAVAAETALDPEIDEVKELINFLELNQLLAPDSKEHRQALRKRMRATIKPWYETLLHHYLSFRVPLVRPDAFLQRTLPWVEIFFSRGFAMTVFAALLACCVGSTALAQSAGGGPEGYRHMRAIDNLFSPRIVRVPVGGEVSWGNEGRSVHNVVADDGSFASETLNPEIGRAHV